MQCWWSQVAQATGATAVDQMHFLDLSLSCSLFLVMEGKISFQRIQMKENEDDWTFTLRTAADLLKNGVDKQQVEKQKLSIVQDTSRVRKSATVNNKEDTKPFAIDPISFHFTCSALVH